MKHAKLARATAVSVVMEAEVARQIRQHGRSSPKAEVCGVLIGREEGATTIVEACIAGVNAAQGGAHVTFTQDTWEHIYAIKDKKYPNERIVGWYHSHPGFGVFLSDHDLFIQQNFFSSPQQIAWVYDPHSDEEGCFGWRAGAVEKIERVALRYVEPCGEVRAAENGSDAVKLDTDGDTRERNWTEPVLTAAFYLLFFVLGAAAAWFYLDSKAHFVPRLPPQAGAAFLVVDEHTVPIPRELAVQFLEVLQRQLQDELRRRQGTQPPAAKPPVEAPRGGSDGGKQ
jgi:proteasome lid subunit RPN8/RPN11